MAERIVPSDADEVVIEHPEVPGAIQRIHRSTFSPAAHKEWDPDVLPWMDGAGQPIPGRRPPGKGKAKDEEEGEGKSGKRESGLKVLRRGSAGDPESE